MQTPMPLEVFRLALDHAADVVIVTDPSMRVRYVNAAFERVTGYTSAEALGKKPNAQASARTTRAQYEQIWSTILQRGWWQGELVNRRKSGEEWNARVSIARVADASGATAAFVAIETDVTEVHRLHRDLKAANLEAIYMLSVACEAKDETIGSHLRRVQHYSHALARRLGLDEMAAGEIGYSSIMHDVGKLRVPEAILLKPAPLDEEEWRLMKRHPSDGVAILREAPFFAAARDIAENHHECWDGRGYPAGRRGEDIPLAARITAVADVFDALSSRRPYKEPWPEGEVLDEIRRLRGNRLDPRVADAFLDLCAQGAVRQIREQFP
jgi:PAS domain S-box-containing protein